MKTMRNLVAMLLVACMVFGICSNGLIVLAADFETADKDGDDTIVYVSIGDSMTNGYGMDGYDGSSGIVNYAMETYSNKFSAWLAGYDGEIADNQVIFTGTNGTVDHRQLAMSGLRAEDMHWILELDYENEELMESIYNKWISNSGWNAEVKNLWYGEWGFTTGDYRTWSDFCDLDYRFADGAAKILAVYAADENKNYFTSSYADATAIANAIAGVTADPYFPQNQAQTDSIGGHKYLQVAAEFYQESIKNADVISLALGNTNFGTYMLNEIMDVIMSNDTTGFVNTYDIERVFDLADLSAEMEKLVRDMIDEYDVLIEDMFVDMVNGDEVKLEALKNIIIYCFVSYAVNYIGSVDAILSVNPDAQIIQVALMNAYAVEDGQIDDVTLGDMVDTMYTPVNKFISTLPAVMQATGDRLYKDATFYFAEADSVSCLVDVFGNDFYKQDDEYINYPGLLNGTEGYEANYNSTIRDRFVENIAYGDTFKMLGYEGVSLAEVIAYDMMTTAQKAEYAANNADKAKSCAMYLAFENATIYAGKHTVTMSSLAALGALTVDTFSNVMEKFYADAAVEGAAYIQEAAAAVAAKSNGLLTAEQVITLVVGGEAGVWTVAYEKIASQAAGYSITKAEEVKAVYTGTDLTKAYEYVASQSNNLLTADDVKALYLGGDSVVAAYAYAMVANQSGGMLTSDQVATLYSVGVYNFAAALLNNGYTAAQIEAAYNAGMLDEASAAKIAALHAAYNGVDTATGKLNTAVAGVGQFVDALKGYVDSAYAQLAANLDTVVTNVNSMCYLLTLPQTLSNALTEDHTVSGVLCMNARCLIGTGIGGHPSVAGHESLFDAIVYAYGSDHTVDQEVSMDVIAVAQIYQYLHSHCYLTDAQTDVIVRYVSTRLGDGELTPAEERELIQMLYETLLENEALDDADRIAIIGNVYAILDKHYALGESNANIQAVENIAGYLYNNKYIDDEQAFLMVNFIYWTVNDGVQENDIKDIVKFVYLVIFDGMRSAVFADLGDVNDPNLTATQKLEILMTIYREFKVANPEVADNPELVAVEKLYTELSAKDAEGEPVLLTDEQIFAVVDTAVKTLVIDEKPVEEAVKEITNEANTQIEELPAEKKLEVLEKVGDTVKELIKVEDGTVAGGNENSMASIAEYMEYIADVRVVVENLRAEGLFTSYADAKFTAITNVLLNRMMGTAEGELDPAALVEELYAMLFEQPGHTLEQKIEIVVVIYDSLAELDYVTSRQAARDYAFDLGLKIKDIVNKNLSGVVADLKADLQALYAALEKETVALNAALTELTNEELAVLAEMVAERDALAAELAALEAKLEAVKAGQNIARTGVSDVEALIADLEAAIDETTAAIAALDASIAALNARIEADMKGVASIQAAIAEIEAQILDTEAALAEVEAAVKQLNADLKVLYDATLILNDAAYNLFGLTLGKVDVEALVSAVKTVIEVVPEIVENLKNVYNETLIAMEKAQAAAEAISEFAANIQDEVAAIVAGAETLVGIEAEKLEAIKAAAAAAEEAVNNFVEENQPAVEAALEKTYADLEVLVLEEVAKAEAWWAENEQSVMTAIAIAYWYCQEKGYIDEAKALALEYTELAKGYIAELEVKLEEAKAWLDENLPKAEAELNKQLNELKAELAEIEAELLKAVDAETRKVLEAAKAELQAKIDAVNEKLAELKAVAEEVKAYIATVEAAVVETQEALDNVIVAAQAVGADLVALWNALCNLKGELCELADAVAGLHDAVVEEIKTLFEMAGVVVDNFIAVLESLPVYVELLKTAAELATNIETWIDLAKLLVPAIKELIEDLIPVMSKEEAMELIKALIAELGIDVLVEDILAMFENAIHADYEVNKDSYYVAIGDDSALSNSYVDLLAEELGLGERYNNLAEAGLTVDQAFELVAKQAAELAKADLITVGFNNVAATNNLFNTFTGVSSVDADWSNLVGEYSEYVLEALAEIEAMLVEQGLDAATAALVTDSVNAYAYTYAAREFAYPELVNAIHAINPEALVVIVGTYNDLEDVSLTVGETEIAIGDYVKYLVDAANLQNLVYAFLTENTIYVDAPAVETLFEEALANGSMSVVGPQTYIMALLTGLMNPSEAGHEYIKTQILDALNVTKEGLLGDANGDGKVTNVDAMLVLQYDALLITKEDLDLTVGDVDGDGDVDNVDAMLILQYDAELISVFPAEK